MDIPQNVLGVLAKLDEEDQKTVKSFIEGLQSELKQKGGDNDTSMPDVSSSPAATEDDSGTPFPPIYEGSEEDFDKAADCKQAAADFKSQGDLEQALQKYTEAVLAAPPSALLYANRAIVLLQLNRPKAAERDCDLALKENPDSAKALRVRGKAKKELGKYQEALKDLSASQQIDFDEGTVEDLKFLTKWHVDKEKGDAEKRVKEEEKLRKRAEEIKKAKEEAAREAREQASSQRSCPMPGMGGMGGMPGGMGGMGGMPGGMGGMGGMPGGMGGTPGMGGGGMPGMPAGMEGMMASLMSDPELVAELQKPKVQAAFQELMSGPGGPMGLMSNPAKLQELMSDPEVGPVLQKFIGKLGGGMMPGMGGMGGGARGAGGDDDIPDIDDIPNL